MTGMNELKLETNSVNVSSEQKASPIAVGFKNRQKSLTGHNYVCESKLGIFTHSSALKPSKSHTGEKNYRNKHS
jgi:hypothetical protein